MIKNHLKIAWRNLLKNKIHGFINISGLAVGLAGFLLILLYLNHELSYDTWDDDLKQVYKVSERTDTEVLEQTPEPLADFLQTHSSAVEAATSISAAGSYKILLGVKDKKIYQKGSIETDSSFFKVFPYRVTRGNVATALDQPNSMVISQSVAEKLFGKEDPIGKTVSFFNDFDCVITALMQKPDRPSHLDAEVIYHAPYEKSNSFWQNYSYETYVKSQIDIPARQLEQELDRLFYDLRLKKDGQSLAEFRKEGHLAGLFLDSVRDLHNFPRHGDSHFSNVAILLILAILLLVEGTINFSNLSIAGSVRRAKEVGVRKVLGSGRKQLLWQFMGETSLQCLMALVLAILLVTLLLPGFNREFDLDLRFWQSDNVLFIFLQVGICLLIIILLSGLHPALFLTRYNANEVLKGINSGGTRGAGFRNALIVIQFAVPAFFIIGALIISQLMNYMQTRDKGFSGEQVLRLETSQQIRDTRFESVSNTLLQIPGVQYVSKTTMVPGDSFSDTSTVTFN